MSQNLVELFDPDRRLSLVVVGLSDGQATLKSESSNDEILVPSKWLPKDTKENDRLEMVLERPSDFQQRQQINAKILLQELLKDGH